MANDPLVTHGMNSDAVVKQPLDRCLLGVTVMGGAVVGNAAVLHHHQFVRMQGNRHLVQHADHGSALVQHRPRTTQSQSAWCGGSRLESGSSISSTLALDRQCARQQHTLAFATDSWPSGRCRQSQAWV